MAERGRNWTDEEISALLAIWSEDRIQRQLLGTIRNATVFRTISNKMQERGHVRDPKQCREKIKALKKKYKEAADSLHRSGVGIESDDDLDDHEIFVGFKWFEALHAVMRTRAVVSPPALLDTSASERSTLSSLDLQDQVEPEEEQQAEEEETQISEPVIASSTVGTQAQLESDQPGPSGSSASGTTAVGGSERDDTIPGPSNREDAVAGPRKKKRKTTKVEKMENTINVLYEKFSTQQERARKEAREMEARRIELEERQAQREEERDTQFLMLMREMFSSTRQSTVPQPEVTPLPPYGYPPMYTFSSPPEEDQQ